MRIGIIGTGRIAKRFVPECETVPDTEIAAVYNPHEGSAERFIKEVWREREDWIRRKISGGTADSGTGASDENSGRESSRDIPCALRDTDDLWDCTDAVYIASPHETHYNYITEAIEHGKHVLCEKPMAFKRAQAEEAYQKAETGGTVLMEGLKTSYCPGYAKVLELAKGGLIGEIRYIDACFTKLEDPSKRELQDVRYGGSFTELGSYVLLPVFDVLGTGYESIDFTSICNPADIDIFTKADISYHEASASLICGLGVKSEGRLLIAGTKGYIKADAPWWKTRNIEVHFENESQTMTYDEPFDGDGLRYEIERFKELTILPAKELKVKQSHERERSVAMSSVMERFLDKRSKMM